MPQTGFHKLEKIFLFLTIVTLPFIAVPKYLTIPGLGNNLSNCFFYVGLLIIAVEHIYFKLSIDRRIKCFLLLYIAWQILCLALGLVSYQYDSLLGVDQSDKLKVVVSLMNSFGIFIDDVVIVKIWLLFRFIKDIVTSNTVVFYAVLYVYHLYGKDFAEGFRDIRRMGFVLLILLGSYSLVEFVWLKSNVSWAESFLVHINPLYMDIVGAHGWWPPLLWEGQIRSLCPEPSFFGILSLFLVPFLWNYIFEHKHRIIVFVFTTYFYMLICASNARTGIILSGVQLLMLATYGIYRHKKDISISVISILCAALLGFVINIGVSQNINTHSFVENNVGSMANTSSRSNGARAIILLAHVRVSIEHPVFGVGNGLQSAYVDESITEEEMSNVEVDVWHTYMHEQGVFKSGYPELNKYAGFAAQNGVIGLIIYLLPYMYLLRNIMQYRKQTMADIQCTILAIMLVSLMMAQVSNFVLLTCDGIVMGLLLCKYDSLR